jgi:peroxiredoxin/predicted 2-oxoglutarate/Fe(II)-dependent dioxygenase YbiX
MGKPLLNVGDPAPWFTARSPSKPAFRLDTVAGGPVALCFFCSASDASGREVAAQLDALAGRLQALRVPLLAVTVDPGDEAEARVRETLPAVRLLYDFDGRVSAAYGALEDGAGPARAYRRHTLVLDERLRVYAVLPMTRPPAEHLARVLEVLEAMPPVPPRQLPSDTAPAPVLVVPRVFEPELCRELIDYFDQRGGRESGFMRDHNGRTVVVHDPAHKRRRDEEIVDPELRTRCMHRVHDRLAVEIFKAFQFRATRIERYIVARYDAATGGYFRPHRDNTTLGTSHRRFAVTVNLNTGEYDGGEVRFPEYGRQTYAPPPGGALVFSCSLLHEALPVTRGRRYAFLPFLYDEEAARVRGRNQRFVQLEQHPPRERPER